MASSGAAQSRHGEEGGPSLLRTLLMVFTDPTKDWFGVPGSGISPNVASHGHADPTGLRTVGTVEAEAQEQFSAATAPTAAESCAAEPSWPKWTHATGHRDDSLDVPITPSTSAVFGSRVRGPLVVGSNSQPFAETESLAVYDDPNNYSPQGLEVELRVRGDQPEVQLPEHHHPLACDVAQVR